MALSMYQVSVPVFLKMLGNLAAILDKGAAFAETRKIDPSVLLGYRLAPDMLNLTRQVQIATDHAKRGAARKFRCLAAVDHRHFAGSTSGNGIGAGQSGLGGTAAEQVEHGDLRVSADKYS